MVRRELQQHTALLTSGLQASILKFSAELDGDIQGAGGEGLPPSRNKHQQGQGGAAPCSSMHTDPSGLNQRFAGNE